MRVLHLGHDHVGGGAVAEERGPKRKADHRFHGRQHLPLRNLFTDRARHSESRDSPRTSRGERSGPMSNKADFETPLEPERYELRAAAPYRFELGRRDFFKFLGAGVVVVSVLKPAIVAQESGGARQRRGESTPQKIGAWLHIGENG